MPKVVSVLLLILAFVLSSQSYAADKPPELNAYIRAQTPYGSGTYTAMWMDIYDAYLWTDAKEWSWKSLFAISLHYTMDIASKDLCEKSIQQMDQISPLSTKQKERYEAQLAKLFPDVTTGDTITALNIPNKNIQIYFNGTLKGSIDDLDFGKRFLSIWLSERTSAPSLRRDLLGLSQKSG